MIAGIDIGSRTTKLVVLTDGAPVDWRIVPTGSDPMGAARSLLGDAKYERIVATGYGRKLAQAAFADAIMTEIKACAVGARRVAPGLRTAIDVGGQDVKVIALDDGGFSDFQMNDRCAAGTGRFLEMMAQALGFPIEEFGLASLEAADGVTISSMCAVFSESEVISLIAKGEDRRRIARGVHEAVANRVASLAQSLGVDAGGVLLVGGVALNPCVVELLSAKLGVPVTVPDKPQFVAALGAALSA